MTDGIEDAYARFLASADVATWEGCMDEAVAEVMDRPGDDVRPDALAQALCITIYLLWLGAMSGDVPRTERARERFGELRDQVRRHGTASAPGWRTCWGLLLAAGGFRQQAETMLNPDGHAPPEHVLLLVKEPGIKTLTILRRLVAEAAGAPFRPLALEYGQALVSVGEIREARIFAEASGWGTAEPFRLEILASASERLGDWAAAYDAYRSSSWPNHRYRAAMVGAIAGHQEAVDDPELDEPMRQYLGQLDGDLDQADIARCSAFLSACLWHPVDDWRVQLELGKLSFRRRHYAEADQHLVRAARSAPPDARFALAQLRFSNLTWLTSADPDLQLPLDKILQLNMLPEALMAGQQALGFRSDADDTSVIRTWLASITGDLALIPISIDDWGPMERGDAYAAMGETGQAVDCYLESLESRYYHRPTEQLARLLHEAGCEQAATYLADLVFHESADHFLGLWETALVFRKLVPAGDADVSGGLEAWQDRVQTRLTELSQFDFINSLRLHHLGVRTNQPDLAEEMLQRAAKQAESVSELLVVAVLRRESRADRPVRSDQDGLWCLMRARGLARDRHERLQIARELFHYGFGQAARGILAEEGTFRASTRLPHSEMITVLQCGPWLTAEQRLDLVQRAARQLNQDHRSGALGKYAATYVGRLLATTKSDEPLLSALTGQLNPALLTSDYDTTWPGQVEDDWPAVRLRIDEAADSDEDAPASLSSWLGSTGAAPSFGLRLMVTSRLRMKLEGFMYAARLTLPALPPERVPIARSADRGDGVRTIQLCDLWRTHLTTPPVEADRSAASLREFFAGEQQLLGEWEAGRRTASEPVLRRAVRTGRVLDESLATLITPDQREHSHPVLRGLFEKMATDTRSLRAEAAEQVSSALRELEQADEAGAAESIS